MEQKGVSNRRKIMIVAAAFLIIGLIGASLIYRGTIAGRITGAATGTGVKEITESEAANKLITYLDAKYGDAKFFRSEDLGMIYLIVVEHAKQQYNFYVTKDGKYFSNAMERLVLNETATP